MLPSWYKRIVGRKESKQWDVVVDGKPFSLEFIYDPMGSTPSRLRVNGPL